MVEPDCDVFTLGLLVFLAHARIGAGLLVSASSWSLRAPEVFSLLRQDHSPGKTLVSWVGCVSGPDRTTFPLIAGLPNAELLFNIVFYRADIGALQGWSIPLAARMLP
jgi:cell volume regulation protein A